MAKQPEIVKKVRRILKRSGADVNVTKEGRSYDATLHGLVQDISGGMATVRGAYDEAIAAVKAEGFEVTEGDNEGKWDHNHGWFYVSFQWPIAAEVWTWDETYKVGYAGKQIGMDEAQVETLRRFAQGLLLGKRCELHWEPTNG